jgi:RNA polymerase sigma-70 factor (ECF subfamily)
MPGPGADAQLTELMQAAQRGDASAYHALLTALIPRLRQIVGRQRGFAGQDVVEDLVQDILLSVHAVRATYDASRPFMPWLLAIVRYRLADGARRYGRTAAREIVVDDLDVTFAAAEANTGQDALPDVDRLRTAIEVLPAGQRQAIELLKLRELSLKEAAAETGQSVGALKVATHRAVIALRRALGRRQEQE